MPEWYSFPADDADMRRTASHAAEMLRAAGYRVQLDPRLYIGPSTTPSDPQGLKFVGAAVTDATGLLAAAHDAGQAERAVDHILDPTDGALARLHIFLEMAAQKYHDPAFRAPQLWGAFAQAADALAELTTELTDAVERSGRGTTDHYPLQEFDSARHNATARTRAAELPHHSPGPGATSAGQRGVGPTAATPHTPSTGPSARPKRR
ncbi:hypothetical protein LO772_29665 [Yinghuangia sp. ASG 101]|uniref:hypothetical protein n=1 Tax=Yinghuangia sp. ASG 101 TaxID=2896848 RepID=UPI001E49F8BA|nr:hypothetical protein [Yinghuangia sp. ASG 101]UGQ10936.1 hypothetical protein LO772_29665 [Yinghuangia sp. ASG 101]